MVSIDRCARYHVALDRTAGGISLMPSICKAVALVPLTLEIEQWPMEKPTLAGMPKP